MARVPGYLIVVRRDQPELYQELQAGAAGDELVQVIMDRRRRDRRVISRDVPQDRRRRIDRRQPLDGSWDARGFVVARVYRPVRPKPGNGFHNCLELPAPRIVG
jgi:hypothetical protein